MAERGLAPSDYLPRGKLARFMAAELRHSGQLPPPEDRPGYEDDPGPEPEPPGYGDPFALREVLSRREAELSAQIHENAKPLAVGDASGALPIEWADNVEAQLTCLWLVKRFLPALGIVLLYGHPGCGKSFLAFDIAFHIALGWNWHGRKVQRGLVIYVAAEGGRGVRNRIVAFRKRHCIEEPIPFAVVPVAIDMQAPDADIGKLIATIRAAAARAGAPPRLIVLDTLSKTFGAGKENTDDMVSYIANCQRIASAFGCCVMPVHHRPKDAESVEPRGHGSLKGGVDTVILVEDGKPRSARLTKQKDGELGEALHFDLNVVELGHDEDGEPVTSCVVEPITSAPRTAPGFTRKLSDVQAIVLQALRDAIAQSGVVVSEMVNPANAGGRGHSIPVVGANLSEWAEMAMAALENPDRSPDSCRRMFQRARDRLQAIGAVKISDGFAWITAR